MDGTIFKMPLVHFQAWLRISYDDTQAFLAGDMSFYDAKHKVAASDASDPHHPPGHLRLRTLRAKLVRLETTLGLEENRLEKRLEMLRKNKAMLSEVGLSENASFYEIPGWELYEKARRVVGEQMCRRRGSNHGIRHGRASLVLWFVLLQGDARGSLDLAVREGLVKRASAFATWTAQTR